MKAVRLSRATGLILVCAALAVPCVIHAQKPKTPPPATQKPKPKPAAKPAEPASAKPATPAPKPGLTMRTAYTSADGQASETKLITNGMRQRVELGDGVAVITQCDAKQILQVNDKAKIYVALPLDAPPAATPAPPKKTGLVEYATAISDTGEKKDIFGLSARHVTTVVTRTPTPMSCDKKKERVQTDGWYASLPVTLACTPVQPAPPAPASDCRDEQHATTTGEPPAGKPLAYTVTTFGDDGKETGSAKMEVKELSLAPVDNSLLDAPAGYTKAPDAASFVKAVERAENEARWGAPKAVGTIRIGVLMPANKTGEEVSVERLDEELLDALTVKPYEAVPVRATSADEQAAEAKGKEVDYLLALDLATLKTSAPSKVGGLMRKASGGGSPTELHEAKVEYRLFNAGSAAPRATKSASAKSGAFTLKRAIGLARFAARLYFGASTSMMRMMLSQTGGGTAGIGLPSQNADPSLNAVSLVLNLLGEANSAPVDEMSREATIVSALRNASSDILKDLGSKKGK
ncbi:MAG TPA: hypothetical protein VEL51_05170 [Vicinamibacterales bacterium]|nr:hypothetical protein [Vicinamibacterales bacterium]